MRSIKSVSKLELDARPYLEKIYGPGILHHAKPDGYPYMPDYYDPATRTVVFVNGCWWHRCERHYRPSGTRNGYWENKIASNAIRDRAAWAAAAFQGYRLHVVWEHELKPANGLSEEKGNNDYMAPCLRPDDKKLALLVAEDSQHSAEKIIDNAQAERGAGNVAEWVGFDLRTGRARLRQAMKFKERIAQIPECR